MASSFFWRKCCAPTRLGFRSLLAWRSPPYTRAAAGREGPMGRSLCLAFHGGSDPAWCTLPVPDSAASRLATAPHAGASRLDQKRS